MEHIVIRHLSGSKANQVEQFPTDDLEEILLGREPGCSVLFDQEQDDLVSRRHAMLRVSRDEKVAFAIIDLGSSNGTFVNGARVSEETELLPDDVIELGAGGPKFVFDVEPRPAHLINRTRMATVMGAAPDTRVSHVTGGYDGFTNVTRSGTGSFGETGVEYAQASTTGVGRHTVERLIRKDRKTSNQLWMYGLAGVLCVMAAVGGVLYYQSQQTKLEVASRVDQVRADVASELARRDVGMTSRDIFENYEDAVVYIEATWFLYDQRSGKQIFHKFVSDGEEPAYVRLGNGDIVRWLTTDDENQTNRAIKKAMNGTGFVAGNEGFILTNKHIAAGWMTTYEHAPYERCDGACGRLFEFGQSSTRSKGRPVNPAELTDIYDWIPGSEGYLFEEVKAEFANEEERLSKFIGRGHLVASLPGQIDTIEARLIRQSREADIALIRIDVPFQSTKIAHPASLEDPLPREGERVTVMGYPSMSEKNMAIVTTVEGGDLRQQTSLIPEPTVTEAVISNIGRGYTGAAERPSVHTFSEFGDVYQLPIDPGHGISGGPVFSKSGRVVAVMAYRQPGSGGESVSFAVPIKYGRDLLEMQGKLN